MKSIANGIAVIGVATFLGGWDTFGTWNGDVPVDGDPAKRMGPSAYERRFQDVAVYGPVHPGLALAPGRDALASDTAAGAVDEGLRGAALAFHRVGVTVFTRDAVERRDQVGADALGYKKSCGRRLAGRSPRRRRPTSWVPVTCSPGHHPRQPGLDRP